MQLRARQTGFVRTEGGLLPADLLERVRALDRKLPGLDEASYELATGERFGEVTARSWNRLVGAWTAFQDGLAQLPSTDPATTATRERFLLPLMEELGYGRLSPTKAIELDGKSYPVSHAWQDVVPLHLVGANVPLDRRTQRVAGASNQSPHGLLQELLNRSPDRLWGIVSNGLVLRILRDNASLTRQAYVEFDLEAIFSGESYADFALLWHLAHRTRLEPRRADGTDEGTSPTVHGCYLERWTKVAEETGSRARDRLRDGVQEAIEALGSGFLRHSANTDLKAQLQSGELSTQDYYRELLRLVYRLILLFVAEDRDLLLDPKADPATRDRYTAYYSTARLRRLAERRKGSRHADLYAGLRVVIDALGRDEGAPGIGLPPLGGFLFGSEACLHLDVAELANADLLDAIRQLATIEERGVLRSVDYRNLESDELGSIYESLLERHPEVDIPSASFALKVAAGHERKTTGSYYTPSSLISVLLDSALDPVLAEAADKPTKDEAERAILELSVVDPAAGSGHFLVAAAHRIAKRLAQVRTGDEEPAPTAITTSLRDVIGHCLYAVDINPMAVELCKVSLWLEALEPGKPLTFLDAHIKCGNSLLGTTPELIAAGIPDAAYDPIEGDDKDVARALKKRNKAEREGQLSLGEAGLELPIAALAEAMRDVEALPDGTVSGVSNREARHRAFLGSEGYRRARLIADAWTAAFVMPKVTGASGVTTASVRHVSSVDAGIPKRVYEVVRAAAEEYGTLHFAVEFPQVAERGGFDVVLGNPPWEKLEVEERSYFSVTHPEIATARTVRRKQLISRLRESDPVAWRAFQQNLRESEVLSAFARSSGRYPLAGRGKINTYVLFAELMRSLTSPRGRVGFLAPTGIATDNTTSAFFSDIAQRGELASLYDMGEIGAWFPDVHGLLRFSLITLSGRDRPVDSVDLVFQARDMSQVRDTGRHFSLARSDFWLLNPNTGSCPMFLSRRDADLARAIYASLPVLIRDEGDLNPWALTLKQGLFNMSTDAHRFVEDPSVDDVPVYEAKMIHQFNHRFGDFRGVDTRGEKDIRQLPTPEDDALKDPRFSVMTRYWVNGALVSAELGSYSRGWMLGWRAVVAATNERTAIASALPAVGATDALLLALSPSPKLFGLLANFNTFVFDWLARQKVGGISLKFFIFKQLPVLPPSAYDEIAPWTAKQTVGDWLRRYIVELVDTSEDVAAFGRDAGWHGPPFRWDSTRRSYLRAEVDAAFFHLYGIGREDVSHIMDAFPIVRERDLKRYGSYRTLDLTINAFDRIASSSSARPFESVVSPGPGDPSLAHHSNGVSGDGAWIPWAEVVGNS